MADGLVAPSGLGSAGLELWESVAADFELNVAEQRALAGACRSVDELARLEEALDGAPVLTVGSTGQPVVHPLFGEVRAHRTTLVKLLRAVGLGEAEDELAARRSAAGRALVSHRWGA